MTATPSTTRADSRRRRSPGRCRRRARAPASLRVAPARDLGDDGGVPGAAGRGDRARDVIGKDPRQDDPAPPQPAADAEIARGLAQIAGEGGGAGDDVEQDVPLRAQDHQRRQPDVGVEPESDDQRPRRAGRAGWRGRRRGTARAAALRRPRRAAARARRRPAPRPAWRATISTTTRSRVMQPSTDRCRHLVPGRARRRRSARSARAPRPRRRRAPGR